MVRLWVHENARVFSDRLNDDADVNKLFEQLYASCRDFLKEDLYVCLKGCIPEAVLNERYDLERQPTMMTEFIKFSDVLDKSTTNRCYDEITYEKADELTRSLSDSLDSYNNTT